MRERRNAWNIWLSCAIRPPDPRPVGSRCRCGRIFTIPRTTPFHRTTGERSTHGPENGLGSDRRRGARSRAARPDRVIALRRGAAEASLMHAVLIGADLVFEVVTGAVDRDRHDALGCEARESPEHTVRALRLDDSRLGLIGGET